MGEHAALRPGNQLQPLRQAVPPGYRQTGNSNSAAERPADCNHNCPHAEAVEASGAIEAVSQRASVGSEQQYGQAANGVEGADEREAGIRRTHRPSARCSAAVARVLTWPSTRGRRIEISGYFAAHMEVRLVAMTLPGGNSSGTRRKKQRRDYFRSRDPAKCRAHE
jgi:hypothetical protein